MQQGALEPLQHAASSHSLLWAGVSELQWPPGLGQGSGVGEQVKMVLRTRELPGATLYTVLACFCCVMLGRTHLLNSKCMACEILCSLPLLFFSHSAHPLHTSTAWTAEYLDMKTTAGCAENVGHTSDTTLTQPLSVLLV